MNSYLGPRSQPYIDIAVLNNSTKRSISCLIDTGFSGGLALPEKLRGLLGYKQIGSEVWTLADGSKIERAVYGRIH